MELWLPATEVKKFEFLEEMKYEERIERESSVGG